MFTGIVQGRGVIKAIKKQPGLVTLEVELPQTTRDNIERGASISIEGVCLTVTEQTQASVQFDVMQQTLTLTTLGDLTEGDEVNVERSAKGGAEIGGHILSGHIDTTARLVQIEQPENNYVLHFEVDPSWMNYIFPKGYLALNGASLTIASVDRPRNRFTVWLIPETLRLTTFGNKTAGQKINLEIERSTQVIVDTVRRYLDEKLGKMIPALEALFGSAIFDQTSAKDTEDLSTRTGSSK